MILINILVTFQFGNKIGIVLENNKAVDLILHLKQILVF